MPTQLNGSKIFFWFWVWLTDRFLFFIIIATVMWACVNKPWRLWCFSELCMLFSHHRMVFHCFFMLHYVGYQKILLIISWFVGFDVLCFIFYLLGFICCILTVFQDLLWSSSNFLIQYFDRFFDLPLLSYQPAPLEQSIICT